jgi:hypothetical protein
MQPVNYSYCSFIPYRLIHFSPTTHETFKMLLWCSAYFICRYIGAIEKTFSPLLAGYFLNLMCGLCFTSYAAVTVIHCNLVCNICYTRHTNSIGKENECRKVCADFSLVVVRSCFTFVILFSMQLWSGKQVNTLWRFSRPEGDSVTLRLSSSSHSCCWSPSGTHNKIPIFNIFSSGFVVAHLTQMYMHVVMCAPYMIMLFSGYSSTCKNYFRPSMFETFYTRNVEKPLFTLWSYPSLLTLTYHKSPRVHTTGCVTVSCHSLFSVFHSKVCNCSVFTNTGTFSTLKRAESWNRS